MRLRVRSPNGILNIGDNLTEESTLKELKIEIQTLTNIDIQDQCLKANFPPKTITNPNTSLLAECGISDGDQIILIESKGFGSQLEQSSDMPTKTTDILSTSTGSAKPEPLPHNVTSSISSSDATTTTNYNNNNNNNNSNTMSDFSASFYASGSDTGITNTSSVASATNNIDNNNFSRYPSTCKGKAVVTTDGILIIKEIPDDNSCLFNSVRYVTQNKHLDIAHMRKIIADSIKNDPINFNDAILGKPIEEYIKYIQQPKTWGGYIELLIFSDYFKIEICSIDVKTNRVDRFGEGKYKEMVFLVYNGIHYDAVALKPFEEAPEEVERTIFESNEEYLVGALKALGKNLKEKKLFTDTSSFNLRCGICNKALIGEKEAIQHANATGHTDFREF